MDNAFHAVRPGHRASHRRTSQGRNDIRLFNPDNQSKSEAHKRAYAYFELAYTINDVGAAALFLIGSILFFDESTSQTGTWMFLAGSAMFGLRPVIRLMREIRLLRIKDYDDIQG